jgi:hypothetical protein
VADKEPKGEGSSFQLWGPGPFRFPPLEQLQAVVIIEGEDWISAEFVTPEGKKLYVPFSYQAATKLVSAEHGTYPLHEEIAEAVPLDVSEGPYPIELPYLEEFFGPLQFDSTHYSFGFVNQKDQRFYVSFSERSYGLLLEGLKTALIKKQQSKV